LKAQLDAEREAKEQQAYSQRLQGIMTDIESTAKAKEAELVSTHPQGKELVFQILVAHHNETGKHLSTEEAVQRAEAFLDEKLFGPMLKTKKAQQRLTPAPAEPAPTLSNGLRQPASKASDKDDLAAMIQFVQSAQQEQGE
jgi:hypothetical protein